MACSAPFSRSTRRSSRASRQQGFSLVEILIVVAIMGLLVGLVGPNVMGQFQTSRTKTAEIQIEQLRAAADMFAIDMNRYPTQAEGLAALVAGDRSAPGWRGPYLKGGKLPVDPWGRAFRYDVRGSEIQISTLGADGQPGGTGADADIIR
jgi:general secretion pathway protein G